jgi:hypothetical protein
MLAVTSCTHNSSASTISDDRTIKLKDLRITSCLLNALAPNANMIELGIWIYRGGNMDTV